MIRKVYLDFIRDKIAKGNLKWLFSRGRQYFLIHTSFLIGKPLCGPILGTFFTTYKCNYRCRMCDLPSREKKLLEKGLKELPTANLKALLKDFADLGTAGIGFTGGEPLMREDIFELLEYAKDLGMITHLNTNGFFLDEKNTEKLFKSRVDSLNISLDGAKAETHDRIRGHSGAFEKVVEAVRLINKRRGKNNKYPRIKIVSVLNEINIDEVPALIKLSLDLGTDCMEFIPQQPFFELNPSGRTNFDKSFFEKLDKTTEYLLKLKRRGISVENSPRHLKLFRKSFKGEKSPLVCFAGYNSYAVDCYGEIYPCMPYINWGRPAGNIKDISLKKFWSSSQYNQRRRGISKCKDCYLNCQAELNLLFNLKLPIR